jgi:hypothetical protein
MWCRSGRSVKRKDQPASARSVLTLAQ